MTDSPLLLADDMVVGLAYSLFVEDEMVDSTEGGFPFEFILGHKNIIPGLEKALIGMSVGEEKDVFVEAAEAYGEYDEEAFIEMPRTQLPPSFRLVKDRPVQLNTADGRRIVAYVDDIGDDVVKMNLNHPLAGKDLLFKASVVSVRQATPEEVQFGQVGGGGCASCTPSSGCSSGSCG